MPLNQGSKLTEVNLIWSTIEENLENLNLPNITTSNLTVLKTEILEHLKELTNVLQLL